jgi:S-adenosylmethionine:tRNA ribosyltransferase-isomerase
MKTRDFNFDLPKELIAQYPLPNRSDSRMLAYNLSTQNISHKKIIDLPDFLQAGDLLVLNNTKVIPARMFGHKASGGAVEILVERIIDDHNFLAHIRASKAPKNGTIINLQLDHQITVINKQQNLYLCHSEKNCTDLLDSIGQIPLPPYMERLPSKDDLDRYQTVYAEHKGSVAAPTAGLHLTETLLNTLKNNGVKLAYCTLHIGAGTFQPVRTELITDHVMHKERYFITQELIDAIDYAKNNNNRIIAVGTTAMRSLESFATYNHSKPGSYETGIFIYPGYEFKLCNGLLTNFHLPESTLLMLVAAFVGRDQALHLYNHAVMEKYRFFSYGDACLFL